MPFKSEAQRRFLFSQKPEIAAEFEKKTSPTIKLPKKKIPEAKQNAIRRHLDA